MRKGESSLVIGMLAGLVLASVFWALSAHYWLDQCARMQAQAEVQLRQDTRAIEHLQFQLAGYQQAQRAMQSAAPQAPAVEQAAAEQPVPDDPTADAAAQQIADNVIAETNIPPPPDPALQSYAIPAAGQGCADSGPKATVFHGLLTIGASAKLSCAIAAAQRLSAARPPQ